MSCTYEYPRPALTVDVIALCAAGNGGRDVLLVRRAQSPFEGMWALPGGFVDEMEPLEQAARRELEEETGLRADDIPLRQVGTFGDPGRDPRGWTVSVAFVLELGEEGDARSGASWPVRGGDDAEEAAWHSLDALPALAFDHDRIIEAALRGCG